ncbi:MAG: ATP-binding cassette domain-containing protein [Planctomycetia bacterium]|nr:ATP-binding cassette domain-containing protein [Planctomycetia bacterium]
MQLSIRYPLLPKAHSLGTSLVMNAFGVDFDAREHVVCDGLDVNISPGQLVLFTGSSGSGKSSLLRAVSEQLSQQGTVVDITTLSLPELPLVDALPLEVKAGLDLLAACGLSEAQLLLRTPSELSEGQRYRFRLALGLAQLMHHEPATSAWLLADEFTATLDRTLAKVLSFNLSRLARKHQVGCLLATTHEDIAADLQSDVHVRPGLDGRIEVAYSDDALPGKRRISFFPNVGTVRAPVLTGLTLPLGTIAATPSA